MRRGTDAGSDAAGHERDRLLALIHTSAGQNWCASNFDRVEFACDGYSDHNTIGILTKDVESVIDALPPMRTASLPRAIRDAIPALRPLTSSC